VERENPHRPVQLLLQPENFNFPFMRWHLRDTSRLREVVGFRLHPLVASRNYWDWTFRLLANLSWAPQLRSLDILPPRRVRPGSDHERLDLLVSIGDLSGLESLTVRGWEYTRDDVAPMTHLSRLQNLKVRNTNKELTKCAAP